MEVPQNILNIVKDCPFRMRCLKDNQSMCEIERIITKDIQILKKAPESYCPNQMTFGFFNICTCPARSYLFEQENLKNG